MKSITALFASVIAVTMLAGAASAGSPDGAAGPWADAVVRFVSGPRIDGAGMPTGRNDAAAALGPAEAAPGNDDPIPLGTFVSLGFGGELTLAFQNPICNGAGRDMTIDVREITKEPYPPETADVYVSADGTSWLKAGTISRDSKVAVPKSLPIVWFVAFVDTTSHDRFALATNADGFDIDGVRALDSTSCTGTAPPMPPAGAGDPLASAPPRSPTVRCTNSYWKDPRVLKTWPIARAKPFNTVFGVRTFPRMSLLRIAFQPGGGSRALAREGVLALLTSLTKGSGYPYKAAQVRKTVRTALVSRKASVIAKTVKKLSGPRTRGVCPRRA
jgi:hypothetical protein